ncbi:hypothetical protein [Luteibacter yeojuensis]|uniref:Uncharacterized protein n=1 Tax=Luteibacter yeojuensis TaxID=345309 RepID=A0A0F3L1Q7_9GAMM|nr:hypothetical protein [Luteibacter yeojuensis]KJV37331.1 hypothetical protein VI08_00520 [Luteibacter yeojuensis]
MLVFPRWSTTLFAFAMTAAAAAYAQDRDAPRHPPRDPAFEAALDACWVDYDGEADDPVPQDMMDECMASKGFPPHAMAPDGDDDDFDPYPGP